MNTIIDDATINELTLLLTDDTLTFWSFRLNNTLIKIVSEYVYIDTVKQDTIAPEVLANHLRGNTLINIRKSIQCEIPKLYDRLHCYLSKVINYIDDKIMEKLSNENAELKERVDQLNDKFNILLSVIELNSQVMK